MLLCDVTSDDAIRYGVSPSFLTFSFPIPSELFNSQKGVTLISNGVCLYPYGGMPKEFIRRLK